MKKVTLITGDGIGPEIVESVKMIFKAANVQIEWDETNAGTTVMEEYGTPLPEHVLDSIRTNKVALKAPLTTPVGKGIRSVNVQLRKELDLYANIRPIISLEGVEGPLKSDKLIDLVIVRENTEGLYAGVEHYVGDDAAESVKITTKKASNRIVKKAIDILVNRDNNKRLTAVHKANILKFTDGLFLECFNNIVEESRKYLHASNKDYVSDDIIVDNMMMQLIQRPETFDVIVTTNLYGDIISDLCAALVGGLGVAPGANIGNDCAIYEAIHGTAPDIAGMGIANPTSLLLSAVMMLRDNRIKDYENADRIEIAIKKTLKERINVTGDLGGTSSTLEYTKEIIKNLK